MALNETEVVADFVGVGNEPIEGVLVELELERPIRDGQFGEMYLPERRRAVSDELGQIRDFHVVSNEDEDAYPEHVGYTLTITYPDGTRTRKRVSVPDLASVSVFDLLNIEPGEPGDGDVGPAGPQGPEGPQGPAGTLNWRGAWDSATEYNEDDAVEHEGSSWVALATSTNVEPGTDGTAWSLSASKGDTGDQGPKGDKGDQGDPGPGLEYDWDGTQLGVRVEGDPSYQYTDLEGPQGPKGDTGDFENIWQGSWDGGPHDVNDVVEHEGTSYISLVNSNTDEPPSPNWDTVAAKGVDGDGVPDGGLAGEYLRKASDTDQDVAWQAADAPTQAEFDDHSARHQSGGADVINVGGLSGELADPQPPKSHALGGGHDADTLANLNAKVSDATLDDAGDTRTPASHGNEAHSATFATEAYVDTAVDNVTNPALGSVDSVATEESTTQGSYGDLPTHGPEVTVDAPDGASAVVIVTADMEVDAGSGSALMSFETSGASPGSPSEIRAVYISEDAGRMRVAAMYRVPLSAGETTYTAKYRTSADEATFQRRSLAVIVVREGN